MPPRLAKHDRSRLSFLVWYAIRDLFRGLAWWGSWACILAMFSVATIAYVILGVSGGFEKVRQWRLQDDPLALFFIVGNSNQELGINDAKVQELDKRIRQSLQDHHGNTSQADLTGCYPYHVIAHQWARSSKVAAGLMRIDGRTLSKTDPLRSKLRLISGPGFRQSSDGVVVTSAMLRLLGYDPENPPQNLQLMFDGHAQYQQIPLLGVSRDEWPGNLLFVMTEEYDAWLLSQSSPQKSAQIRTGPVSEKLNGVTNLVAFLQDNPKLLELFDNHPDFQFKNPRWDRRSNQPPCWKIECSRSFPIHEWSGFLTRLANALKELGYPQDPGFVEQFESLDGPPIAKPKRGSYSLVSFVMNDPRYLRTAEQAASEVLPSQPYNKNRIRQIEGLVNSVKNIRRVLDIIAWSVLGLGGLTLIVAQTMRAREKRQEIGMLRAMGMSRQELRIVYFLESCVIWCVGVLLGLALGWVLGQAFGQSLAEVPEEAELAFFPDSGQIGALLATSFALCVTAMSWATRRARTLPPIRILSEG